ncbi:MAG: extracellular solute-binding protein [Ruminiclostridium sp.]|nr:extracellular solute-binding protein [Ruminiclostridium sp.]
MLKKLIGMVLAVVLITSIFAGCGAQKEGAQKEGSDNVQKEVTLNYWAYWLWSGIKGDEKDGQPEDWHKYVLNKFTESNPKIKVNFEMIPWAGGPEKVNVAIASKTQPDVLIDSENRVKGYAARGATLAVDEFFTKEEIDGYIDKGWDSGKYAVDGKHYFVPFGFADTYLVINKTIFDEAGATNLLPNNELNTWTFDEFKTALKAVSKNGIYGFGLTAKNEQGDSNNFSFLFGFGARTFSPDLSKIVLNSPEGVKGMEFLLSLVEEKLTAPNPETQADLNELFTQKKLAIIGGAPSTEDTINADLKNGKIQGPFELARAMYPNLPGKDPVGFSNNVGVAVFKSGDADREAAAVKLAKYFGSAEIEKTIAAGGFVPFVKSAVKDAIGGSAGLKYAADTYKFMVDPGFGKLGYAEVRAAFYPELQAVFIKTKTPQQALDDFVKIATEKVAKAAEKK